jgi:alpha-tubulin suppressor-like RCC1 family protein
MVNLGLVTPQICILSKQFQYLMKMVKAGNFFSIVLTNDGILYSFGQNEYAQLGLNHSVAQNSPQEITFFSWI